MIWNLILIAFALFGLIQLPYSIKMALICSRIFLLFKERGYPKLDVKQISKGTGYNYDDIVTACIADKRLEQIVMGCYEAWQVPKHWRY